MEQKLASQANTQDKSISSGSRDFDTIKPNPNAGRGPSKEAAGLGNDPVYQSDRTANKVSESYEGFTPSKDIGIKNLEKSDGFGSKFQMPGQDMSEKYMNRENIEPGSSDQKMKAKALQAPTPEFVDLETTLKAIQELVVKIRANLESPEQGELEALMLEGSQILQQNWTHISTAARTQVSALKADVKDNPYRALIAALKIGMAVSQVVSQVRAGKHAPVDSGEVDMSRVAL